MFAHCNYLVVIGLKTRRMSVQNWIELKLICLPWCNGAIALDAHFYRIPTSDNPDRTHYSFSIIIYLVNPQISIVISTGDFTTE